MEKNYFIQINEKGRTRSYKVAKLLQRWDKPA